MLLQICKKINIVPNTEICFCHQYIISIYIILDKMRSTRSTVSEMSTVGNTFAIFQYQFTSTVY